MASNSRMLFDPSIQSLFGQRRDRSLLFFFLFFWYPRLLTGFGEFLQNVTSLCCHQRVLHRCLRMSVDLRHLCDTKTVSMEEMLEHFSVMTSVVLSFINWSFASAFFGWQFTFWKTDISVHGHGNVKARKQMFQSFFLVIAQKITPTNQIKWFFRMLKVLQCIFCSSMHQLLNATFRLKLNVLGK